MRRSLHAGASQSGGLKLDVFTADELEQVHLGTLEVLQHTGLFVEDDEALAIFASGGADVDRERRLVKIPPYMVEEAARSAPASLRLAGRSPHKDFVLEADRVGFTNFGEGITSSTPIPARCARPPSRTSPTRPRWSTRSTT